MPAVCSVWRKSVVGNRTVFVQVAVNAAERARIARELANTKRLIGSLAVDFNRAELDELNFVRRNNTGAFMHL